MSGFGAIFVFIGVMPVLTNIIVTTTASSNLLSPGVPRLFVSDLCRAPISKSGLWSQRRRFINGINAKLQTRLRPSAVSSAVSSAVWCDAWYEWFVQPRSPVQRIITVHYRGLMHIRWVRSGCRANDRWSQESNVVTSVFTFLMLHIVPCWCFADFNLFDLSRHCPEKKRSVSVHFRSRPVKWSIESLKALLSTFLTLF